MLGIAALVVEIVDFAVGSGSEIGIVAGSADFAGVGTAAVDTLID